MRNPARSGLALAVVLVVASLGATASAQCFGPDQLDVGPCCGPTLPFLPVFPNKTIAGLGICWDDCAPVGTQDLILSWTPPFPGPCGEYISQLTVDDASSGIISVDGLMTLSYMRTWDELDPSGTPRQVWRFVVRADLEIGGGAVFLCTMPSCLPPFGPHDTAYYYGYLDYATCTTAGPWESALVLYHGCDRFNHTPGFSDRPGVFHPTRSYGIVAPHSTLQPFVPANNIAPGGPVIAEATRSVDTTGPFCVVADRVVAGDLTPLGAGCLCTLSTFPNQNTLREFSGATACGGAWTSLNILFPTLPWLHLVTTSIGSWTNPAVYPGDESAWVDEGLFVHQDACTGDFVELKYGGSTAKGWPAVLHTGVATQDFLDLANNYSAPLAGPHPLPIFGSVRPTEHLISVNVP